MFLSAIRDRIPRRLPRSIPIALLAASAAASADPLTRQEIVRLVKAGTSDEAILARIREEKPAFAMTVEEMLRLSRSGVSTKVLTAMMTPGARPSAGEAPTGPVADPPAAAEDAFTPASTAPSPAGGNRQDFPLPALDRMSVAPPDDPERPRPGWMPPFLHGFARCLGERDHPLFRDALDPYRGRRAIDRPFAFWRNE